MESAIEKKYNTLRLQKGGKENKCAQAMSQTDYPNYIEQTFMKHFPLGFKFMVQLHMRLIIR